jgi:hypothetical protein
MTGGVVTTTTAGNSACLSDPTFTAQTDVEYIQGGTGHAIQITAAGSYDLDGLLFTGYGNDGAADAAIFVSASTGTVTLNILNNGDTPTFRTAGATVVINNTVALKVTALDANTLSPIQSARVLLIAGNVGPENYQESVSIVESGGTATVTHTSHNLNTGDEVLIEGCNEPEFNGVRSITVTGANTYTYLMPIGVGTATGSPISTTVLLSGDTDVNGEIQNGAYNFLANQDVSGRVRKGTASPFYKTSGLTGTITSAGYDVTALLIPDE